VYVADAVAGTVAALAHDGGTFNVGTGKETSVLDLLARIQGVAGTNVEPEFAPPRSGELQRSVLDVSRAAEELGWRPAQDLDAGLAATWAWAISQ
jgi:UDP-glucose 4-epimerase